LSNDNPARRQESVWRFVKSGATTTNMATSMTPDAWTEGEWKIVTRKHTNRRILPANISHSSLYDSPNARPGGA
jgi:hypothetical protein